MEAGERALLDTTVRNALIGAVDADAVLGELGWLDMLAAEPRDAIATVFRALGACDASATVLDDVIVSALGDEPRADLAVLLPPFGSWAEPGTTGLVSARAVEAAELLVGHTYVPMSTVKLTPIRGVDPDARLHTAATTTASMPHRAWGSAVALARHALGHQLVGASRAMLDLARAHAVERVQFGRPIGRFQAVRHRLAEALIAIEAAEAALDAAGDEPNATTASLAKALAGRAAHRTATHCQQVLGGIGFTTDHTFHRYLKRTMVLDGLFGSADAIAVDLGHQLIAAKRVPTLIEL
jgi:Acyl-CoA dehydrogenase, C-terminal domain